MVRRTHWNILWPGLLALSVLFCCATISFSAGGSTDSHPSMVKINQDACTTCHEDLLIDLPVVHPPVADDCTSCHEVEKSEGKTSITLMAPEPELCIVCHDGMEAALSGDLATPHAAVMDSCLSCHNVHAGKYPKLLLEPRVTVCLTCHDSDDLQEVHKDQLHAAVDCTTCHLPHGGDNLRMLTGKNTHVPFGEGSCNACHRKPFGPRVRLRATGNRLCTSCHGKFEVPEGGMAHDALREVKRRAGCLRCHDPHMSNQSYLTRLEGPALCSTCHSSIVASANGENGHAPAADDCTTCHAPHVGEHEKLLVATRQELCTSCHDIEDQDLKNSHLGADMTSLSCGSCHDPHGGENEKLLAGTVHPPLLDGCDTCHEGNAGALMEDGESSLCLMCHDDIGETMDNSTTPHPAMEMVRCADCHNPHASAQERLVKLPGNGVCVDCHDDKAPGDDEVAHGVIALWGCQSCHLPHGGENEFMLRAEGDILCRSCHDRSLVPIPGDGTDLLLLDRFRLAPKDALEVLTLNLTEDGTQGHPQILHRTTGTPTAKELKHTKVTFEGELSCFTCHNPHKGRTGKLFRWNAGSAAEACLQCHPK